MLGAGGSTYYAQWDGLEFRCSFAWARLHPRWARSDRAVMNLETVRGVYLWDNRLWVNLSCDDFLRDHLLWDTLL